MLLLPAWLDSNISQAYIDRIPMGLIRVRCPYCFAEADLDDSYEYGVCIHCGFRIDIERPEGEAPPRADPVGRAETEALKDRMFSCYESGDLAGAREAVRKLRLEDDADADAWYMEGVCILDGSEYPLETDSMKSAAAAFRRFEDITGLDVDIDSEAYRRYLKRAEAGDVRAQRRVGIMCSRGMGTPQSQERAMTWFREAYTHGFEEVRSDISEAIRMMDAEHYTVPSFVDEVWDGMFEGAAFRSVTIPEPISRIGARAFAGCRNLESVRLPRTLRSIGDRAFYCCKELRHIDVPASVWVGTDAFYGCDAVDRAPPAHSPSHAGDAAKPRVEPPPAPERRAPEKRPGGAYRSRREACIQALALETAIFFIAVMLVIWSNLDPGYSLLVSVAPVGIMLYRALAVKYDALELTYLSAVVEGMMALYGLVLGFFNDAFFVLAGIVVADVIASLAISVWPELR